MTGHETEHVLKEGLWRHGVLEGQIGVQRALVEALDELRVLEDTLDLARPYELSLDLGIVQGLDAEEIARQKDGLVLGVIDCEGEHAAQTRQQVLTPFLKAVNQHLAVGVGREVMTAADQVAAQILVVIDFTVEGEDKRFVLVVDRLMTCLQVNDGQPSETHIHGVVHEHTVGIRSAVGDDLRHSFQYVLTVFRLSGKAADTTHSTLPFQGLSLHNYTLFIVPQSYG